jgi:zinc D-Ala-D-Ala carboxypeptidase
MTTHYYAEGRDGPKKLWRWPNFSPEEIACRGDGTIRINEPALDKLQALRDQLGVPLTVPPPIEALTIGALRVNKVGL